MPNSASVQSINLWEAKHFPRKNPLQTLNCFDGVFSFMRMTEVSSKRFQPRAHLATIALISFIASFTVARLFTTFYPSTVLVTNGIHIHHFWHGLALLVSAAG